MKEARFYKKNPDKSVDCFLCNRFCHIKEGEIGFCNVRKNINGTLYSLVYGRPVGLAIDPIEKKPFYHFLPGSKALSFGTVGCNFRCKNCQNWDISQYHGEIIGEHILPKEMANMARENKVDGIAYTYNEPTIFWEYANDIIDAFPEGYHVFVSNGYMSNAAFLEMKKKLDAIRIDLKAFNQKVYDDIIGNAKLEYVLENIKRFYRVMHMEIINLVIPGINDSEEEIREMVNWIKGISKDIPLHFIAFYPAYKMLDVPPTPLSTLIKAREIALEEGMRYVYTGNRGDWKTESTYCYNCGHLLIKRNGFYVEKIDLDGDRCPVCGKKQNIILDLKKYRERK